jgi:hypothetical protein
MRSADPVWQAGRRRVTAALFFVDRLSAFFHQDIQSKI